MDKSLKQHLILRSFRSSASYFAVLSSPFPWSPPGIFWSSLVSTESHERSKSLVVATPKTKAVSQ